MSQPTKDEEALTELTKNALAEVLGREPTKQEVWRVHAGFKRMAFMLLDHLDHIKKHDNENPDQETLPEDLEADDSETPDPEGALGEVGEVFTGTRESLDEAREVVGLHQRFDLVFELGFTIGLHFIAILPDE